MQPFINNSKRASSLESLESHTPISQATRLENNRAYSICTHSNDSSYSKSSNLTISSTLSSNKADRESAGSGRVKGNHKTNSGYSVIPDSAQFCTECLRL